MEKFDEQLLDTFEELGKSFALANVQQWAKNLKRRKIVNTKQLLNSLDSDTEKDVGRLVVAIHFAFEEYGRYLDMKKKRWDHQPPIEKILEWVKEKGLAAFGADPKPYKRKIKTDEQRMNEIAWGIGRQYATNAPVKARSWFQSSFYKSLNALYEELSLGVADRTVDAIRDSLTARLKRGATGKYF